METYYSKKEYNDMKRSLEKKIQMLEKQNERLKKSNKELEAIKKEYLLITT
jgi:exonuclease VII small subunit